MPDPLRQCTSPASSGKMPLKNKGSGFEWYAHCLAAWLYFNVQAPASYLCYFFRLGSGYKFF